VSKLIKSSKSQPLRSQIDVDALPAKPEEDAGDLLKRWEALSQKNDWQTILDETENRPDHVAMAYRTLAILESGEHPNLLLEAMTNLNKLIRVHNLPNKLGTRLVRALGDPEAPGPTARENLEAYRDIINSLGIATQPSSLKKLRELEKLAAEEDAEN
jgi:hypothetical protein